MLRSLEHTDILCVSDSLHDINLMKHPSQEYHRYATIVENIRDFVKEDWSVQFVHSLREGNRCANYPAKLGPNSGTCISGVDSPPWDLLGLLVADVLSVPVL